MGNVQFAPKGQSKVVKFVLSCLVILLLGRLNDVFSNSLLGVYVPRAQGIHRKVPAFVICFTLALVQPINNGKIKKILGKVLRNPFTNSGTSLVEYCIIPVSNSEVINNFTFERDNIPTQVNDW